MYGWMDELMRKHMNWCKRICRWLSEWISFLLSFVHWTTMDIGVCLIFCPSIYLHDCLAQKSLWKNWKIVVQYLSGIQLESREVKRSQDKSREVIVVARYIALRILGKNCTWIIHFWMCATARCLPNSNACMHVWWHTLIHFQNLSSASSRDADIFI